MPNPEDDTGMTTDDTNSVPSRIAFHTPPRSSPPVSGNGGGFLSLLLGDVNGPSQRRRGAHSRHHGGTNGKSASRKHGNNHNTNSKTCMFLALSTLVLILLAAGGAKSSLSASLLILNNKYLGVEGGVEHKSDHGSTYDYNNPAAFVAKTSDTRASSASGDDVQGDEAVVSTNNEMELNSGNNVANALAQVNDNDEGISSSYDNSDDELPALSQFVPPPILSGDAAANQPTHPQIRSWGCNLQTSPLLFVHIGKAGGGSVRARFAASALNYTRGLAMDDQTEANDVDETSGIEENMQQQRRRRLAVGGGRGNGRNGRGKRGGGGGGGGKRKAWAKVTDGSYYPMLAGKNHTPSRGYFCNSGHSNRRPTLDGKTFEGTLMCEATTPLGRVIACPEPIEASRYQGQMALTNGDEAVDEDDEAEMVAKNGNEKPGKRCNIPGCELNSPYCHQVYVGHNAIGSEFHWLPPKIMHRFWSFVSSAAKDEEEHPDDIAYIEQAIRTLDPMQKKIWCRSSYRGRGAFRPHTVNEYKSVYQQCSKPLASSVDGKAMEVLRSQLPHPLKHAYAGAYVALKNRPPSRSDHDYGPSWSPLYAALPVLRTTVVREPFTWLVSKYFWHWNKFFKNKNPVHTCDSGDTKWMDDFATEYILKLCGEDCYVRHSLRDESLDSLAFQAEGNLRHGFAVVGLVNETDTFYDMVTKRVGYLNMSLNPSVTGQMHSTSKKGDYAMCQELYAKPEFQKKIMAKHRPVELLKHLFSVAEEVNRFQMKELSQYSRV